MWIELDSVEEVKKRGDGDLEIMSAGVVLEFEN